jgi:hypothetical protein
MLPHFQRLSAGPLATLSYASNVLVTRSDNCHNEMYLILVSKVFVA